MGDRLLRYMADQAQPVRLYSPNPDAPQWAGMPPTEEPRPSFSNRLWNAVKNAPGQLWGMLPAEAQKAYTSGAGAIAELSPGAAIRDAVDASSNTGNALLRGDVLATLGGTANILTAMSGLVPGGRAMNQSAPELFHVVGKGWREGQPLQSLYSRFGDKAYEIFAKRWPEAGNLGQQHAHKVLFYEKLDDALMHADEFGGQVLRVDRSKVPNLYLDTLEKSWNSPGFWATTDSVPAEALKIYGK